MTNDIGHRLRILTVGDGDLSYSLALRRCFGEQIELTATTLLSEAELTSTYTRAAAIAGCACAASTCASASTRRRRSAG